MGANFVTLTYPGELTRTEVKTRFERDQEEDRYENGHSYSGGIGMARGLAFPSTPTFGNEDAAYKYLNENCKKWEEARAVRFKDEDVERWMLGAVCSS